MEKALEKLRQRKQAKIELQRQRVTLVREGKMEADVGLISPLQGASTKSVDMGDLKLILKFGEVS